ncbi:DHHA1 domain-containing protein [Thermococcus sp.]|uniref:alanyl-tRNA editing protein n=1 Tax=Thermococcus sp. TaxID=35749 RepID=UPI00260BB238|nr:DHHA1 domain-containing protein [Thermococcus sp.]
MTERLFYSNPYLREIDATVESVEVEGSKIRLLLDRTLFYPEGGGQPSDRGMIEGDGFRIRVERVYGKDEIWHEGKKLEGRLPEPGESVRLLLNWEWRYENMKNHTGQHILSAVFKELYNAGTTGFQIFESYNKIEVDYPGELDWDTILEVERRANEVVWKGLPVRVNVYEELPADLRHKLRKELSDKVKPPIRVVSIPGVDITPCGGTHVGNTREIGIIKVLNFYRKSRKLWRIEFVCGNRALKRLNEILEDYWSALDGMPNKNPPLVERVRELRGEIEGLEGEIDHLRRELWHWKGCALIDKAEEMGDYNVVALVEKWDMKDAQAFAINFVKENPGAMLLLAGEGYVIFARNEEVDVSMRELLKEVIKELGGKGGGTDNLARGKVEAEPEDVIEVAKDALRRAMGI